MCSGSGNLDLDASCFQGGIYELGRILLGGPIKLFGTVQSSSTWLVTTGKPREIAPAPQATVMSSTGSKALITAFARSKVLLADAGQ